LYGTSDFPFGGGGVMTETTSVLEEIITWGNASLDNFTIAIENEFYAIQELCQGYAPIELVNSSNIAVSCGLVLYVLHFSI
jgi:hypothetical protein